MAWGLLASGPLLLAGVPVALSLFRLKPSALGWGTLAVVAFVPMAMGAFDLFRAWWDARGA